MASSKRRDGQSSTSLIGRDEAGIGPTLSDPHFESLHSADPAAKPSSPFTITITITIHHHLSPLLLAGVLIVFQDPAESRRTLLNVFQIVLVLDRPSAPNLFPGERGVSRRQK
jgi:hypothetical protein